MRNMANCFGRVEALELNLADESAARGIAIAEEATTRTELQRVQAEAMERLDRILAEERDRWSSLDERSQTGQEKLAKDLREHLALEVEGVREMAMREMRERMDGQKVLREEVQLQQQALMGLTSRIDEALIEVRTEVPTLRQETNAQKAELEKVSVAQASGIARLDSIEKTQSLVDEAQGRRAQALVELASQVQDLSTRLDGVCGEATASNEQMRKCADETQECQKQLDIQMRSLQDLCTDQAEQLARKLADAAAGTQEFALAKIRESEDSTQAWVEATAMGRLAEVDKSLKKEMTDRVGAMKDVLERTAHNTDRWCQLQAKFDQLLIEVL